MQDPIEKLRGCLLCNAISGQNNIEYESGDAIAGEIKAAYMKLPVDADGVPIRPGDYMQMALGESAEVVAVSAGRWFFDHSCLADDSDEYDYEWADESHHFKPDTVESLLEKFADMPERIDRIAAVSRYTELIREAVEHERP